MEPFSFPRYLEAKRSVDDRALNSRVWNRLGKFLTTHHGHTPLELLEIGAGTGTMLRRLIQQGWLGRAGYTGMDGQPENVACAWESLHAWAGQQTFPLERNSDSACLTTPNGTLSIRFEQAELFAFIERWSGRKSWDVILANAFLDLVNIPQVLPLLLPLAQPGGVFAFTINFDGLTVLEPLIDERLDALILALYHRSMDERRIHGLPTGGTRSGRRLFTELPRAGYELLEAGSSDWVVFASGGEYPQDEAYFLHAMLHFIEESLRGCPELDAQAFSLWLAERRTQITRGELALVTHQLDFLARRPRR